MGVTSSESHDLTAFYEMLSASFGVLSQNTGFYPSLDRIVETTLGPLNLGPRGGSYNEPISRLQQPVFCGFLGSAILAGDFDGGVGFSYGVWGFVRPLDVFPPTSRWCHMCARWCTSREGARLAKKQVHMGAQKLENGKMGVVGT